MAKDNKEKYEHALAQVRDSLQHQETADLLIKTLGKQSDFAPMVLRALRNYLPFWAYLWVYLGVPSLIITLLVVKFPELANWIFAFLSSSSTNQ